MLTILQARMTSTRLPGKVMRPILGEPMLARQVERVRRAQRIGRLIVATSREVEDDPIDDLCRSLKVAFFRGALDDVLARFVSAARTFGPTDQIIRLTGDCPLADWTVIDAVVDLHLASGADYTSNTQTLTYPKGLDVEVFKAEHLEAAFEQTRDAYDREHVTPFIYRRPERFKLANLERDPPLGDLRWTVDTAEDFAFVEGVYQALYPQNAAFTSEDILRFMDGKPQSGREG